MDAMAGPSQRFYDDDEAEQILNLAASMSSSSDLMSHERLLETAAELGISPEAVENAERQVTKQRLEQRLQAEYDAHLRRDFFAHLTSYVVINLFLTLINIWTWQGDFWAIWPILGWGLGVACHAKATFVKSSDCYQAEFKKWQKDQADFEAGYSTPVRERQNPRGIHVGLHLYSRRRARLRRLGLERGNRRSG